MEIFMDFIIQVQVCVNFLFIGIGIFNGFFRWFEKNPLLYVSFKLQPLSRKFSPKSIATIYQNRVLCNLLFYKQFLIGCAVFSQKFSATISAKAARNWIKYAILDFSTHLYQKYTKKVANWLIYLKSSTFRRNVRRKKLRQPISIKFIIAFSFTCNFWLIAQLFSPKVSATIIAKLLKFL